MIEAIIVFLALIVVLWLYFLPTIEARSRKNPNYSAVFVVNFFLGWTLIGWVVAMAMAVWKKNQ